MKEQVLEWMRNAVDLMKEEIPLFVQEFLQWSLYSHGFGICCGLIMFFAAILFFYFSHRLSNDCRTEDAAVACFFLAIALFAVGIGLTTYNAYEFIKIQAAPRIYLLERFMK